MLDLVRLQMLHRLSVEGTIAATASSLGYSASAVSQQLATLEREVGVTLFDRRAHSIALTDAGVLLVEHARELLNGAERAEAELRSQAGRVAGHLTVSVIPNLATHVAVALADVQRDHPDLDIVMRELNAGPGLTAVAEYQSDLAVTDRWSRRRPDLLEGLHQQTLHQDPVGLAVPMNSPAAALPGPLGGRHLAEVVGELTWLCAPEGHLSRAGGDEILTRVNAKPKRRWEFEGLITIAELVALEIGAAFLPAKVVETQSDALVRLIPLSPAMTRHIESTVRLSSAANPAVKVCQRAIAKRLAGA